MAIGPAAGTLGSGRSSWPSRRCAGAPISRSGCWNVGGAGRRRWSPWWRRATCLAYRPGGWRSWSRPSASPACRSPRCRGLAKELDEAVTAFRSRPLDAGPYTFCWADAIALKVREGGRVVHVHVLIATGVNADGHREILGLDLTSAEDGAGWLAFWRGLVARGLTGVQLITSDAHPGLVDAIAATLPGASWQRCRTHYLRDLLTQVPKSSQRWVATMVRTIFDQPDAVEVHAQFDRVVAALQAKLPAAAEHLAAAREHLLAFTAFPHEVWRQIWSNNPQERLNREIRRRTDLGGIFPDRPAVIR